MPALEDALLDEAERRWEQIAAARPELGPAVELQRVLLTRGLELAAEPDLYTPEASAIPANLSDRFARGDAPVLELAVELNVGALKPYLVGFCDDFAAGGAGDPARNVRRALADEEIEPGSLLRASLLRQQEQIRLRATHLGISPDLVWLVAELTVGPIAHQLQHQALVSPDTAPPTARAALDSWNGGQCPACGSWPALAELRADGRHLRCSFCGSDWRPATPACVYCNETAADRYLTAADSTTATRRLEFCRSCGGYLKQIDAAAATAFTLLPVADLEASDLDVRAVERGYGRPPMRERAVPAAPCPPDGVT